MFTKTNIFIRALLISAALIWAGVMTAILVAKEPSMASLHGQVVLKESGKPLAGVKVFITWKGDVLAEDPTKLKDFSRFTKTKEDGIFDFMHLPTGVYQIEANSKVHQGHATVWLEEGERKEVKVELKPNPSFLKILLPQPIFTTGETVKVGIRTFTDADFMKVSLYRLDTMKTITENQSLLYNLIHPERYGVSSVDEIPNATSLKEFDVPIQGRDPEGVSDQYITLPLNEAGFFAFVLQAGELRRAGIVIVTDIALITKHCGRQLLTFVTDLRSGEPVEGAKVSIYSSGKKLLFGTTNTYGVFECQLVNLEDIITVGDIITVVAQKGDSFAWLDTWSYSSDENKKFEVYFDTDRPVYRPGHHVYFKGIVRQRVNRFSDQPPVYQVPSSIPVMVEVEDSGGNLITRKSLLTNRFGSFWGDFDLPESSTVGRYEVTMRIEGEKHQEFFIVSAYRRPEYEITVKPEKDRYIQNETVSVSIKANYYFGSPVATAKVIYTVLRQNYWYYPEMEGELSEEVFYYEDFEKGYNFYGEIVDEGETFTDESGEAKITFRPQKAKEDKFFHDSKYTILVDVSDQSGKIFSGEGSVIVTTGKFRLSISQERYMTSEKPFKVIVSATDYDGKPQKGVELKLWAGREKRLHDRTVSYGEYQSTLKTDENGQAIFNFVPKGEGLWDITAQTSDEYGNLIYAKTWFWVYEGSSLTFSGYDYPNLEIVADKKVYSVGDVAKLMVNTKYSGGYALLTIEGERIYSHKVIQLKGCSTVLELPMIEPYLPNIFVGICFVKDKKFAEATKLLRISVKQKTLKVVVRTDKPKYDPGEKVKISVKTMDENGKAVSAEVALAFVDESIYAIKKDDPERIISTFFGSRYNNVATRFSFPEHYLQADKEESEPKVRRYFPDTAYWKPNIVTDEKGEAVVELTMPDSLTTWRATAIGHTLDTKVGFGIVKTICTKDFFVRLPLPRSFTQGDISEIKTIVHNNTDASQNVTVTLNTVGAVLNLNEQKGRVAPNSAEVFSWKVILFDVTPEQKAIFTVKAFSQTGEKDAMELSVPVLPHGIKNVQMVSGKINNSAMHEFQLPKGFIPNTEQLEIFFSPSIASSLLSGLERLAEYPFG